MMPHDPKDDIATEWFNSFIGKLQFGQDYSIYPGSSKKMFDDEGKENGISIVRPDIRLYSTGIRKLHDMIVEGLELPDVDYTEEEDKEHFDKMKKRYPECFEDDE